MMSTPAWLRAAGYFALAYRRTWRGSMVTTFLTPVLFLAAMGVGLGSFVNKGGHSAALGGLSYLEFVAPGLAATTAATIGASEALFPVMAAIKWQKTYFGMLATPLRVRDVLAGHLTWIAARVASAVAAYLVVMAAFQATRSIDTLAVLPAGILVGMAFAAPLAAFAAHQENEEAFPLIFRLGLIPLFLFSGVFFPISQLPSGLRFIAYLSPLWHGVDLCRRLTLGDLTPGTAAIHVAYLVGLAVFGLLAANRTFTRRLRV
jgi:lipooligosaccharide transport system permease protein